jgi:hypothetical protein
VPPSYDFLEDLHVGRKKLVFRAQHCSSGRRVIVLVPAPQRLSGDVVERLEREHRFLRLLQGKGKLLAASAWIDLKSCVCDDALLGRTGIVAPLVEFHRTANTIVMEDTGFRDEGTVVAAQNGMRRALQTSMAILAVSKSSDRRRCAVGADMELLLQLSVSLARAVNVLHGHRGSSPLLVG